MEKIIFLKYGELNTKGDNRNFFINTFEQFFPLNNRDYNDFSNIVIDDVSIIITS